MFFEWLVLDVVPSRAGQRMKSLNIKVWGVMNYQIWAILLFFELIALAQAVKRNGKACRQDKVGSFHRKIRDALVLELRLVVWIHYVERKASNLLLICSSVMVVSEFDTYSDVLNGLFDDSF
jgi:hypothetical protein